MKNYAKNEQILKAYKELGIDLNLVKNSLENISQFSPIYTSLSHSDNCAILAISTARVGVDLELIKDRNFSAHIDFCFSKEQRLRYQKEYSDLGYICNNLIKK